MANTSAAADPPAATATSPASGQPAPPGSWLGLLGGGQLGRMFCMAAHALGYRVCVLDPGAESPAGTVADRHIQADYLDAEALGVLGRSCVAVTTEFENVPAQALERLAALGCRVAPGASAVAVAQDRCAEKAFVRRCGIGTAPYAELHGPSDFDAPGMDALFPGIVKVARLGYDGKGQVQVGCLEEARSAFARFAAGGLPVPCVLERRLDLAREISVIVARGFDGSTGAFPVSENLHRQGILARTIVPARIDDALARKAVAEARSLAVHLDYVGVLCVEFFVTTDGQLLVNELAPRPHNSGHYSIDAAATSQFEQQVRVLAGLPLGATGLLRPAVMLNILGDAWLGPDGQFQEPDWRTVLSHSGVKLHLYGKASARPGRKMGHLTIRGDTVEGALAEAARVAPLVGQAG